MLLDLMVPEAWGGGRKKAVGVEKLALIVRLLFSWWCNLPMMVLSSNLGSHRTKSLILARGITQLGKRRSTNIVI
jgi:hypothetical protein